MTRHHPAGLATAAATFVALSGYAATELIERSAPPVTPPSPYTAPEPSADCGTPELDPVHCPIGGGGCPTPAPADAGTAPPEATARDHSAGAALVPGPTSQRPGEKLQLEQHFTACVKVRAVPAD
ncbi:hypothetical protein [Streptomyces sp. V1I6]|uniref:hypothetical protein n=1 Tax=Streptomyces sp. V1I6 TaxID=3042273 RepID=UPI002785D98F|nr:hypothetical protein [Streptomyces sp. V1I6]MDQ0846127.1 hypothetical protein [Streptomyces sp. V1I6]